MSQTLFWTLLALVCLLAEFVVPGAVLGFIGVAAALVGLAEYLGWVEGWLPSLTLFFVCSLFLVLVVRSFFLRLFPGDTKVENVDEDADARGALVDVIHDITPARHGRIRYRDSTWEAESEETILKGEKAVIVARSGPLFIVQSMAKGDQKP
ncbi:MAG TPA: NfeD family protein [Oligoflexus sp.]|uniref:NfeD family protein n=1 Tax=Oligoflexus sp. TaxID=1971216 RepID=UPI002D807D6A|nr:NfeD family protein [Oligoflexus sp.]HET9237108.1 NfeD family protein [Oligoflexus sp.]